MWQTITKKFDMIILGSLAIGTIAALVVIVLSAGADTAVKTAVVVQLASVLIIVVQAIRNVPQGDAMNRMVDHLAASSPQPHGDVTRLTTETSKDE